MGWSDEIREVLAGLFCKFDSLMYEIRNCVVGARTGCTNNKKLASHLRSLAEQLNEVADAIEFDIAENGEEEIK